MSWRVLGFACSLVVCASGVAVQQKAYRKVVEDRRRDLLAVSWAGIGADDDGAAKAAAYKALFEAITAEELPSLTSDTDLNLALQARWELARKPIKRKPKVPGYSDWIYDPVELGKFVEFFSKRTAIKPPKWWSDAIRKVDLFPGEHNASYAREAEGVDGDTHQQKDVRRTDKSGKTTLTSGSHSITVPSRYYGTGFRVIFTKDRAYVSTHDTMVSYPSTLACYAVATGKPIWTQNVWGNRRGGFGGFSHHTLSIELQGDQVVVFGSEFGDYAESFRATDGAPVFKFSSTYWFHFAEAWKVPWNRLPR